MSQRISLQPAFILHSRHYGDTSLIVDVFARDLGRVSVLAKGYRKKTNRGLQPYVKLLLSWSGRSEMKTLTGVETSSTPTQLTGKQLYAALYVNEILLRLLPKMDAHPQLFDYYQHTLAQLAASNDVEPQLRGFEYQLLSELGYGLNFYNDATGETIENQKYYRYIHETGFLPIQVIENNNNANDVFIGADLLAINERTLSDIQVRRSAKRLSRLALAPLLGDRPLKSRELFFHYN